MEAPDFSRDAIHHSDGSQGRTSLPPVRGHRTDPAALGAEFSSALLSNGAPF